MLELLAEGCCYSSFIFHFHVFFFFFLTIFLIVYEKMDVYSFYSYEDSRLLGYYSRVKHLIDLI